MAKRKNKIKLSKFSQAKLDCSIEMVTELLHTGAIPEVFIGAIPKDESIGELDYIVALAPNLDRKKAHYILTRVAGLLDGSIARNN